MKNSTREKQICAIALVLIGCASSPSPGTREAAVNDAWNSFCKSGYCEGYPGTIVSRTDNSLTVSINGNTRYMRYSVNGEPGNYRAQVSPTTGGGRDRP